MGTGRQLIERDIEIGIAAGDGEFTEMAEADLMAEILEEEEDGGFFLGLLDEDEGFGETRHN
jgi:hypothetical protein